MSDLCSSSVICQTTRCHTKIQGDQKVSDDYNTIVRCTETFWSPCVSAVNNCKMNLKFWTVSVIFFFDMWEIPAMFFPQWQLGKSSDVFISREVAYNILEMKPGSSAWDFSPVFHHRLSSGKFRSPYAFFSQYRPYTLSVTTPLCLETEERNARQLHFVVQSLHRLDKR